MEATFSARLRDESTHPLLTAMADLFGRVERRLYVDLHVRGGSLAALKREYLARYGLTARQFNAVAVTVQGKVAAAREAQQNRMAGLQAAMAATEKTVGRLRRRHAALGRRPKRQRWVHDAARAAERARLAFRLHGKRRRLAALRAQLAAAEADRAAGRVHLCCGSRRLFRAQFDLRGNGYADHAAAARQGVEVIAVNAAFTSVIGYAKFGPGYGLSVHAAAAVAIARRGLRFSERLRSRSALPLPARNRGRHVWSDWRRSASGLRALARGRRPSEGVRGRGRPLSTAAPVATQGPPCDGLAADPGRDPPAPTVGKAVRPASQTEGEPMGTKGYVCRNG
jgi:hypothetical protein